ncbi:unnamed protein product [Sphagnum jensenii]|uniref:Uncharacterized protein n=1 Tax=Sphagnum jensenii TaxID=128206 RepID=A0ABP1AHL3_9BRYO
MFDAYSASLQPGIFLDQTMEVIKYNDFVNRELILFSMADLSRSIPSMVDGLKPSQQKFLFCAFKRNFVTQAKVIMNCAHQPLGSPNLGRYGVVRRMASCGMTLNSSCYNALLMAYKNRKPINDYTVHKIFEQLEQSKRCEGGFAEGETRDDFEEELDSLVTGIDLQPTCSYFNRHFTVYFAALRAFVTVGVKVQRL